MLNSLKKIWHEDLVKNPQIHSWVLNLYRSGELYPQTVLDYFPWKTTNDPELAQKIQQHEQDEKKHAKFFEKLIVQMEQPLIHFGGFDVFNAVVRSFTPHTFHILETDSEDQKKLKMAHFFSHAHCLEKRVLQSLTFHQEACENAGKSEAAKIVGLVLNDEARHVQYTYEAISDLIPRSKKNEILIQHQKAEEQANVKFSRLQAKNFLRQFGNSISVSHKAIYRFCDWLAAGAERVI